MPEGTAEGHATGHSWKETSAAWRREKNLDHAVLSVLAFVTDKVQPC